jgi:hypothetical protein
MRGGCACRVIGHAPTSVPGSRAVLVALGLAVLARGRAGRSAWFRGSPGRRT